MQNDKNPNPLNVLEMRRVRSAPPHFDYLTFPLLYNIEESVVKWIVQHLSNRFYVGRSIELDKNNKIVYVLKIGFEDSKEASYFMLACPILKYK
jgi:hypothetical protein